jgi:integral membrane protein (TIGR00529 family)
MFALGCMAVSLGLLVVLMHRKVKLGRAIVASAVMLGILLRVTPPAFWHTLVSEWRTKPLPQTPIYLWVSLTALVMLVNVLGIAMKETGVSDRLAPALQRLFRSRRFALASIPMIMGLLPTPGGIMLSAPMVRDLGDSLNVERSRQASINFLFRHQWETVWPLFPSVPLIQGMFGISAMALISHNIAITVAGTAGGVIFLLAGALPKSLPKNRPAGRISEHLHNFGQALWPIALVATLYVGLNVPPAIGIAVAIVAFLACHRVPVARWRHIFKKGFELDFAFLILGALLFKVNLEAGGAVASVVDFFTTIHAPAPVVIFFLPFVVAFLTGVTVPTVAMTFPFLLPWIGTGQEAKIGLETLAFSGVICGLLLTPVHLCLALSCTYFESSFAKIVPRLLIPVVFVAAAGVLMALFFGR